MTIVMVLFLLLTPRACWRWSIPVFALVLLAMFWAEALTASGRLIILSRCAIWPTRMPRTCPSLPRTCAP